MLSDEENNVIDLLKNIDKQKCLMLNCPVVKNNIERQLKIIELNRIIRKQSKEIERTNEIIIWKQRHEEQLQKEIERLKDKLNKIYNETDNKNSQLVKALNYKLFMEDKIKAKIEELEKLDFGTDLVSQFTANLTTITILQSLLNEEE